ncbi:MAG TPA: TetR/AcrR family transcriptional regulator [Kofleriaceae bacterium]|jgi:TetR/AcrR family transcriptional repressor of nem operon
MARTKEFEREYALERAMNIFWERGYEATSMADLLEAMGIGRQSMYDTFGDKRALFIEALERYIDQRQDEYSCMVSAPSVKGAIRGMFEALLSESPKEKRRGCFGILTTLELAPHDPGIAKLMQARQRILEDVMAEALTRAQKTKELGKEKDPRALARFLLATFSGLRVAATTDPHNPGHRDIVELALKSLD